MAKKKSAKKKSTAKVAKAPKSNDNSKICAILAYLVIGIIWYFVDEKLKKDAFVKFHVKQGLVLLIMWIVFVIVGSIIPVLGGIVMLIGKVVYLVGVILGIINALNGKQNELPVIGQFAKKFTW